MKTTDFCFKIIEPNQKYQFKLVLIFLKNKSI